jgi:X-X-X-Leu-X-X-Gly heptad repeat protein
VTRLPCGLALLAASAIAHAQATAPQPTVDPKAYPALTAMLATLQNGSEASRYCAQTGGLFLEADALLRKNVPERDVVEALVAQGRKGNLGAPEVARLRQLASGVTQLASGFQALAAESSAVAYTQTCLASARSAPGTRDQVQLNERYTDALACDKRFQPGSLEGKECIAKAFRYR